MGNRLTKTEGGITTSYVYDLCNKLLSETTEGVETTYSYDALGNLTEKVSSEGITTYVYDAMNQLEEVVNPDGTWQRNTYDASGIRSMMAENGVTIEFMNFNGLVLSGYNKNGEQTEHYYYGNSLLTAEYTEYTIDSYGEVTAENSLYYYLKNSHGDVIGFTDSNGILTETYRYDAFGTLTNIQSLNENGVLTEAETALSRFLYAGEQLDATTGLYYLRARQYDTFIGRFTQEDTYLGGGRNLYVYVGNNPLKYVDPSGHCNKKLGYAIELFQNTNPTKNYIYSPYGSGILEDIANRQSLREMMKEDAAGKTNDLIIGIVYEFARLATFGLYHDPEAEKVRYEEAFQFGVDSVDIVYFYLAYQFEAFGTPGSYGNTMGGLSKSTQIVVPGNKSLPMVMDTGALPPSVIDFGNQSIATQPSIDVGGNQSVGVWNMPEGGGVINGREYSQHALERMAPDTLQVRAELSRRAEAAAEKLGYKVGTEEYYEFCRIYVDPRNIPPSAVENAISSTKAVPGNQPGTFIHETADLKVIVNSEGKVITVIPK